MKSTYIILTALLIVGACKSTPEKTERVQKEKESLTSVIQPIAGLEIPPTVYEVISDIASKIDLPNGGSIEIPEHAFVDLEGNPIKGKVNLEWAEFHSLTDIMLSGIPMKYDSAGVQNDFVSGGMFTINANQNGEKLAIADGKELMVNLVSTDDTPCYNFYKLNEETGDWSYKTTKTGTPIAGKAIKTIEQEAPKKAPVLIDCELEYSQFPELKGKDIVAWRATEDLTLDEKRRIKTNVSLLTLQKDDKSYFLDFKRKDINSKIRVEPYLLGEAQSKTKELKTVLLEDFAALKTYYQDVANGKIVRSIALTEMGTHNWDRIMENFDTQIVYADFNYGQKAKNPELASLFYISTEANVVMRYSPVEDRNFRFLPKNKGGLIAIMPNNEVYIMKNEGFKEIAAQRGRANCTFQLQSTGVFAKNGNDVAAIARSIF